VIKPPLARTIRSRRVHSPTDRRSVPSAIAPLTNLEALAAVSCKGLWLGSSVLTGGMAVCYRIAGVVAVKQICGHTCYPRPSAMSSSRSRRCISSITRAQAWFHAASSSRPMGVSRSTRAMNRRTASAGGTGSTSPRLLALMQRPQPPVMATKPVCVLTDGLCSHDRGSRTLPRAYD